MDWSDLRHFLALARTGSVRAAGGQLGVSHSTVARRIEALEEQLGARLFDRSRDGFTLTEAGRRILPGAERVEAEMAALEREVVGRDERLEGTVSITFTDRSIAGHAMPALADLCRQNPGLELQLTIDRRNFDLSRREADIAVRAVECGHSPPEHLLGSRLGPVVLACYVGRDHVERLDPDVPGSQPRWAGYSDREVLTYVAGLGPHAQVPCWGSFDASDVLIEAAVQGLGLIMVPTYMGDCEPRLARLKRPALQHMADFWLLSHPDLRTNARLRAARRCLVEAFDTLGPVLRGDRPVDAPGRPGIGPRA